MHEVGRVREIVVFGKFWRLRFRDSSWSLMLSFGFPQNLQRELGGRDAKEGTGVTSVPFS